MRELFIDELAAVTGGQPPIGHTTDACCEEGPFGCCGWWLDRLEEIVRP